MSTHIVDVCRIAEKRPHPNADRLEFVRVKGWWVLVQKALDLKVGAKVIYIPPDSVIPDTYAEKLGITKYCSPMPKRADGTREPGYRVRAARLRGEASYGTIDTDVPENWDVGRNVAEELAIRKWEPPLRCVDGDAERPHPAFHTYTDIESFFNFPAVLVEGERVSVTEKLHGMNCRLGLIYTPDENGEASQTLMAGSHSVRRKQYDVRGEMSAFWRPLEAYPAITAALTRLAVDYGDGNVPANVVLFGELINTQKGFRYGVEHGTDFRAFDVSVNGRYLDWDIAEARLNELGVPTVPELYRGPFSWSVLESFIDGPTTMCSPQDAGTFKGREGVVVKPVRECFDRSLPGDGRVILKAISVDYLEYKTGKGGEDADVSDA